MPQEYHDYTVGTPHGDHDLSTPHHHSTFQDLKAWYDHHRLQIKAGQFAYNVVKIYILRGKSRTQLK